MSIRRRDDRGGQYQVQWREGGRQRSRMFARKGDAVAFEADLQRRKQLGPIAAQVIISRVTLADFVQEDWWPRYAIPDLDEDTRRRYLEIWDTDLRPRLGGYQLREITPELVEELRERLARRGLAPATQKKTLMLLSGILKRAAVRGLIPINPVSMVQMPKVPAAPARRPLAPLTVERIRHHILTEAWASSKRGTGRSRGELHSWRQRNALIVSLLAYGGLRPVEDRSAVWGDLQDRTLRVFATKTKQERHIDLLAPLAQDLAEWRLACGRPGDNELIVPRATGGEWTRGDWANWRTRVWRPAATAAGVTGDMRPYRLRGSFVSLLLWSGEDLVYVAEQAGHSVATLARHYAGVMRELKGQPRVPAAEAIRLARAEATGQLRLGVVTG